MTMQSGQYVAGYATRLCLSNGTWSTINYTDCLQRMDDLVNGDGAGGDFTQQPDKVSRSQLQSPTQVNAPLTHSLQGAPVASVIFIVLPGHLASKSNGQVPKLETYF